MGYGAKFMIFIACISFMLYVSGYTSPFSALLFMGEEIDWISMFVAILVSPAGALGVAALGILFAAATVTRSPLVDYILKLAIIIGVANIFVLPFREIISTQTVLPIPYNYFFVVIINIMLISAIMSYLSGDGW